MRDSDEGPVRRLKPRRTFENAGLPGNVRTGLEALLDGYRRDAEAKRRGVVGLFAGPAATDKTAAAEALAGELGRDLYRVDLSRAVSKYIGETEKNLDRIFEEAEAAGAVLFFDEADALFGRRSEVEDSHDRYANAAVAYLLKRIESYPGIVVLATNVEERIDDAFLAAARIVSFTDA